MNFSKASTIHGKSATIECHVPDVSIRKSPYHQANPPVKEPGRGNGSPCRNFFKKLPDRRDRINARGNNKTPHIPHRSTPPRMRTRTYGQLHDRFPGPGPRVGTTTHPRIIPGNPHFSGFNRHARATKRKDTIGNCIHNTVEPAIPTIFLSVHVFPPKIRFQPGRLKIVQSRENFPINCRLIYVRTANRITHADPRSERYAGKGSR